MPTYNNKQRCEKYILSNQCHSTNIHKQHTELQLLSTKQTNRPTKPTIIKYNGVFFTNLFQILKQVFFHNVDFFLSISF